MLQGELTPFRQNCKEDSRVRVQRCSVWHRHLSNPRLRQEDRAPRGLREDGGGSPPFADSMRGSFLGPGNSEEEIKLFLEARNLPYRQCSREELAEAVAWQSADRSKPAAIGIQRGVLVRATQCEASRLQEQSKTTKRQSSSSIREQISASERDLTFLPSLIFRVRRCS